MKVWIGPVLALIRHYLSDDAIKVVKDAIIEAYLHDEWDEGEKTKFVIDTAEDFARATPTKVDDLLIHLAAKIYLAKFAKPKPQPKPEPLPEPTPEPQPEPVDPTSIPYTLIDEAIAAAKKAGDNYGVVTKGGVTGTFFIWPLGIGGMGIAFVWKP